MHRSPGGLRQQIDDEADHQVLARRRAFGDEPGRRRQRLGVEPVLHALLLRVRQEQQEADALVAVGEGMVLTTRWSRFAAFSSRERSRGSPNMVCLTLPRIESRASPRGLPNRDDTSPRTINSRWNAALVMAAVIGDAPFPAPFLLPNARPCLSPLAFDDRPDTVMARASTAECGLPGVHAGTTHPGPDFVQRLGGANFELPRQRCGGGAGNTEKPEGYRLVRIHAVVDAGRQVAQRPLLAGRQRIESIADRQGLESGRAAARVRALPERAAGGPEPPPAETPYPRP